MRSFVIIFLSVISIATLLSFPFVALWLLDNGIFNLDEFLLYFCLSIGLCVDTIILSIIWRRR